MFRLYVTNKWLDLDVTYTPDKYWLLMECWSWPRVKVTRSKIKDQCQLCKFLKKKILTIYHEPKFGHWWYVYIRLISIRCWSWLTVNVTRLKLKVKYATLLTTLFRPYIMNQWLNFVLYGSMGKQALALDDTYHDGY